MDDGESKQGMSMAIPNGIILGVIGMLVLVTPAVTELSDAHRRMDLVAGVTLVAGAAVSLLYGRSVGQRNRHSEPRP